MNATLNRENEMLPSVELNERLEREVKSLQGVITLMEQELANKHKETTKLKSDLEKLGHTGSFKEEIKYALSAAQRFNIDAKEVGDETSSGAMYNITITEDSAVNVAQAVPQLPLGATVQEQLVFNLRYLVAQTKEFFTEQPWGQAQIAVLYVFTLHYYALFYKRSCI